MSGSTAELAVVVMSYRNESTVLAALGSLLAQAVPLEVVVSHSGGGDTAALVRRAHPDVRIIESARRRHPGATRNAGVAATVAPHVAFLAADCLALPGWAAGRIDHHRRGAAGVASALVPTAKTGPSLAANLLQHSNRLPGYLPAPPLRFGVSYTRDALKRWGPFPEGAAFPEDVAVNERLLADGQEIAWAPEVLTAHAYPVALRAMLADQHRRGRVHGALHGALPWRLLLAGRVPAQAVIGMTRAARGRPPLATTALVRAAPALALAVLASASGKVRGGGPVSHEARAYTTRRRGRRLARLGARGRP